MRPGVRRWVPVSESNTGEALDCFVYSYAAERYEMRKNGRLRRLVDEIDPAAQEAALAQVAETAAAARPDPGPDEIRHAVQAAPEPDEGDGESRGVRFRVVRRTRREAPPENADARQDQAQKKDERHRMVKFFDPFFLLSDAELEESIRDLARQMSAGEIQISSPHAGSVGYVGRAEALRIMKSLQRSYFRRRGEEFPFDRIKYTQVLTRPYRER